MTGERRPAARKSACAALAACSSTGWVGRWLSCWVTCGALLAGCGSEAASPFGSGGGGSASVGSTATGAGGGEILVGSGGAGGEDDPTLGGPCEDDATCDDGADCTGDRCDQDLGRCRFTPDASACQDGVHCNGEEVCTPRVGCEDGSPFDCGDDDACTIDTCVEDTQTCSRQLRDADGDGDPDGHCTGGGDCDDLDPTRSSAATEVCANRLDDDCDGDVDETGCTAPPHDDCEDALEIEPDALLVMTTAGADLDVGTTCAPEGAPFDVIATVTIPAGAARDLDVRGVASQGPFSIAIAEDCGDRSSELACGGPAFGPEGAPRARALARSVPPGEVTVIVTTAVAEAVSLDVRLGPATIAETNETCGTAADLAVGEAIEVDLVDAAEDLGTACARATGELVWRLELEEPAALDIHATSLDGLGNPSVSLRAEACALPEEEVTCRTGDNVHIHRNAVPAGVWYVALSASAPTRTRLVVEASDPAAPLPDEDCEGAPTIEPGSSVSFDMTVHQDDHAPCVVGSVDAAYTLEIARPTDLLLVQRTAPGDPGGIALADAACTADAVVACSPAGNAPVRLRRRGLGAGDHRIVLEGTAGGTQRLDVLGRPALPAISVPFADGCGDVLSIPRDGGYFVGNTAGASADLDAGCDDAGGPSGGAPERLLRLDLDERSRVVLDASGSTYRVLLDVREGPDCPGIEVPLACTVTTSSAGAAFLDLELEAGTYFVQVDGRSEETGAFQLDVHVQPAP